MLDFVALSDVNALAFKNNNRSQDVVAKKQEILDTYVNTQKYVLMIIFGVTIVGTLIYANEKKEQYGGGFSIDKFLFN